MQAKLHDEDGILYIEGCISFATVLHLRQQGEAWIKADRLRFDFSRVEYCDSSVLALLLAWKRVAQNLGMQVQFLQTSAALQSLASVCNVEKLLLTESVAQHKA